MPTGRRPAGGSGERDQLSALARMMSAGPLAYTLVDELDEQTPYERPEDALADLTRMVHAAWIKADRKPLRQLAKEVGCHESTLSRVFKGKMRPNQGLLDNLAETFNVSTKELRRWHDAWRASFVERRRRVPIVGDGGRQSSGGCPVCGVGSIASWPLHIDYHRRQGDLGPQPASNAERSSVPPGGADEAQGDRGARPEPDSLRVLLAPPKQGTRGI